MLGPSGGPARRPGRLGRPHCYHSRAHERSSPVLPDHGHRVRELEARRAHAVRGDRRRRHRALAPDEGRRDAVPDRDGRALDQHRPGGRRRGSPGARIRRRKGRAVQDGRGRPGALARPLHPDDRPRSRSRSAGDGPPGVRQRRHLHGHVRGLVLPERGLPQRDRRRRDRARDDLPQPSRRPAPVADRAQLVLPAVRLPGAPGAPLRRPSGLRRARVPAQRDARLHPGRARGLLDLARAHARRLGHPVPDRRERRDLAARGRLVGPGSRQDLRLVRRADQLHHWCGLPRRHRPRSRAGGRPICT